MKDPSKVEGLGGWNGGRGGWEGERSGKIDKGIPERPYV